MKKKRDAQKESKRLGIEYRKYDIDYLMRESPFK
jgi:hypothetical protein